MTFSDAEEDQPSTVHTSNTTTNVMSASSTRPDSNAAVSNDQDNNSTNNDKVEEPTSSNAPVSLNCISASGSSSSPTSIPSVSSSTSTGASNSTSQVNEVTDTNASEQSPDSMPSSSSNVSSPQTISSQMNSDLVVSVEGVKGLETKKVLEKLQQIHGYIQQTAAAMQALEHEGDLNKIGQYNTLVKCMRQLKKSEEKLTSHLNHLNARSSVSDLTSQGFMMDQFEAIYDSLHSQENECVEILSKSLHVDMNSSQETTGNPASSNRNERESGTSGSSSIGVVGPVNGEGRHLSMQDRLARHENEQIQLSERLRESLVRRQELMARYQATRERLNNLKRQRLGLVQEERRLLQSVGAPENPYDDPIPGSETWTIEQLENAIHDFQGLRDKVDNLHQVYSTKMQAIDENDTETRMDLQRKIEQIINKKRQIGNALTQMAELLQAKREREQAEEDLRNLGPDPTLDPPTVEVSTPDQNGNPEGPRAPSEDDVEILDFENQDSEGAVGMSPQTMDLMAKQQHLKSLKSQLAAMKQMLNVTENAAPSTANANEPTGNDAFRMNEEELGSGNEPSQDEPLADSTIVGINGEVIHLSETERRNPQVVSKFQELSQAKQRLAKMEEIMQKIAEARQSGLSLSDVLSPENMAVLNAAREEEEGGIFSQGPTSTNLNESREPFQSDETNSVKVNRPPNDTQRQTQRASRDTSISQSGQPKMSRVNDANRNEERPSSSNRSEWEREREISAMQYHLKKTTPKIPPINEGFKMGREKGAIKKQTRDLLNEGGDPRLVEMMTLQEELKEKKNALEALMRRMGKSSSFTLDNISDNISENISDVNSDITDRPSASWGGRGAHHAASLFRDHSDDEIPEANDAFYARAAGSSRSAAQPPLLDSPRRQSVPRGSVQPKNRNRLTPPKLQHNPDHNSFSVNNLSASQPKSVRPKHNRYATAGPTAARNVPTTSWETVMNASSASRAPENSNNKVQNTVASALTQLSQVQDTINTLYGELRTAEMATRQQEVPVLNPYGNNTTIVSPQLAFPAPAVTQNLIPSYSLSPLPNTQGRGDLGATNHILAGLQQCFSQLYLHSLEIQSLSKHLQIIDQRDKSLSPPHFRGEPRGGSTERRGDRPPPSLSRRENETSQQSQNFRLRLNPNFHVPRFDERKDEFYLDREEYLNLPGNQGLPSNQGLPRNGVSNPLYVRLSNTALQQQQQQQQQPPSWLFDTSEEVDLELAKNFSPFDGSASEGGHPSNGGDAILDSSSQFPLDADEMNEELPWPTVASPHAPPQPPSDILNNQVLPGTRANNYWDNFRSYSRQNPLSTTAKSNTGDQLSLSGSSTPGRAQGLNTSGHMQQPMGLENKNRHFNMTSHSNNSINKASDKNSSSSRSQNRGGARARYPTHQTNERRSTLGNSFYQHNTANPPKKQGDKDQCKRNNRQDFITPYEREVLNHSESIPNVGSVSSEDLAFSATASPFRSNNSRRLARERGDLPPRNSNETGVDICVSRNTDVRRPNATTATMPHDDGVGAETFDRVVREAESLMQKHSQQPHFLFQLFHHAAKITSNTDQQVALELLRELSYQRHQNNIQHNRWRGDSSVSQADGMSLPSPSRDTRYRNTARFSNKTCRASRGISGSDASESGITSDDDDAKVLNRMVKNLTPTASSSGGGYPPHHSSPPVFLEQPNIPCSPMHSLNALPQNQHSHRELGKELSKDLNIVASASKKEKAKLENQAIGNRLPRRRQGMEASLRNYIASSTSCDSPSIPSNSLTSPSTKSNSKSGTSFEQYSPIGDKANNRRQMRRSPRRNICTKTAQNQFGLPPKGDQNTEAPKVPLAPANGFIQEPASGFEAIVSSSLREVLLCFESADYSSSSTSQILDSLLHSIMRQVQYHSSNLGFSTNFVSSIDSQLKSTLRGFYGKSLSAIRQELAAAVTQVLIHEYCSLFTQDIWLESKPNQNLELSCANEFRNANIRPDVDSAKKSFPSQCKQGVSHSLFSSQDTGTNKQAKSANASWSLGASSAQAEGVPANRVRIHANSLFTHSRGDEEFKGEATGARGKGAIAKNCTMAPSHADDSLAVNSSEVSNCLLVESPLPEASFPESWVIQRSGSAGGEPEGLYSFPDSASVSDRNEMGFLSTLENSNIERNDAEADQDNHARIQELHNLVLAGHDLAEADQSQDAVEAGGVDSATENDHHNASAPPYSQSLPEPSEFGMRFFSKKKPSATKEMPEQGLDEVPTRLLSAAEGSSPPLMMNGRSSEEGNEDKVSPHRFGPFSPCVSSSQAQASANALNEQTASQSTETSSGKGG